MSTIQIFDSESCAAAAGGQSRNDAIAELDRARQQGAGIEQYDLTKHAAQFAGNAVAKEFLESAGPDALPLVLVDGKKAIAGRYPTRAELARWSGLSVVKVNVDTVHCCSGGNCG